MPSYPPSSFAFEFSVIETAESAIEFEKSGIDVFLLQRSCTELDDLHRVRGLAPAWGTCTASGNHFHTPPSFRPDFFETGQKLPFLKN